MKTLILTAIRCSLMFTAVTVLSIVYPTSVQAVPTTYHYTGHHFTDASGPYTTSDFVTAMVTLAAPLPPNFGGTVTPTAFTLSDGVQTLSNTDPLITTGFEFATDANGGIRAWIVFVLGGIGDRAIQTRRELFITDDFGFTPDGGGGNVLDPGVWTVRSTVSDAGSTLSLMTLTLLALGLVARRFQRAAA